MTAEQVSCDRALALLFSLASGQRVMAEEVHADTKELAARYHRTAEQINQLARRAPEIWADEDRKAATAANVVEGS